MICGMDIGQQSTLNILESRWGAIFESERGLAKFLSFFSLEWSWKMHGSMIFFFEECQLKGKGEGGENYLSYKRYRTTQKTESK